MDSYGVKADMLAAHVYAAETVLKGRLPNTRNGVGYLVADEDKGTVLLMGAGTFPRAEGKVEANVGGATYSCPNGYAFDPAMH